MVEIANEDVRTLVEMADKRGWRLPTRDTTQKPSAATEETEYAAIYAQMVRAG